MRLTNPTNLKRCLLIKTYRVIHELGGLLTTSGQTFATSLCPPRALADIIYEIRKGHINGNAAKKILSIVIDSGRTDILNIVEERGLALKTMTNNEYQMMATHIIGKHPAQSAAVLKGQSGKLKFLVGQMMRASGGAADPQRAEQVLQSLLKVNV